MRAVKLIIFILLLSHDVLALPIVIGTSSAFSHTSSCVELQLRKSDDDLAELKKVSEKLSRRRFSATMSYQLFENYTSSKPIETQHLEVKTWDLMTNIKSAQFHMIRNKEHYMYVDFSRKFIMLNKVYNYKKELDQVREMEHMMSIDTLIKMHEKITVLQADKDTKTYRIFFKDGAQYAYTDVMINTVQSTLVKMTMYYAKKLKDLIGKQDQYPAEQLPRMEVRFSNFISYSKLDPSAFSVSGYLSKKGKQFVLANAYAKYKFINNTNY